MPCDEGKSCDIETNGSLARPSAIAGLAGKQFIMSANPEGNQIIELRMNLALASIAEAAVGGVMVAEVAWRDFHQNGIPSWVDWRVGSKIGAGSKISGVLQLWLAKTFARGSALLMCQRVLATKVGSVIPNVWKMERPSILIATSVAKLSGFGSTLVLKPLT